MENKFGEGNCYGNFGLVYYNLGDFKIVIDYFKFYFNIFREMGNLSGEGRVYGNFGNLYYMFLDFENVMYFFELSL